jgi:hypothetical protein
MYNNVTLTQIYTPEEEQNCSNRPQMQGLQTCKSSVDN